MMDWRELERARIASGVPVRYCDWVCTHEPRAPEMPQRSHPATPKQRMWVVNTVPQRDAAGRWSKAS